MAGPEISVIIPVKNAGTIFAECLASIRASRGVSYEIVVVDDGSSHPNTREEAQKFTCRLISLPRSHGPSNARNIGAENAHGDILFFIDSDVVIYPDTLKKISDIFNDPAITGITGVQSPEIRFKNFYSQFKNLWMRYTYLRLPEKVALFYTSCAAIKKDLFLQSGGFDIGYTRPSVEDTDFGHKLEHMGHLVQLRRDIEVEHVKSYTLIQVLKTDFHRSSDLVKMMLRNGLKKIFSGNQTSVPSSFQGNIILFLSSLLVLPCWFFYPRLFPVWLLLLASAPFFLFLLNHSLLSWLKKQKGGFFALKSYFFLIFDIPIVTAGVLFGLADFCCDHKY